MALLLFLCTSCSARRDQVLLRAKDLQSQKKFDAALRVIDPALQNDRASDQLTCDLIRLKASILNARSGLKAERSFRNNLPPLRSTPTLRYCLARDRADDENGRASFDAADRHLLEALQAAGEAHDPKLIAGTQIYRSLILLNLSRSEEARRSLDAAKAYASRSPEMDAYFQLFSGKLLWRTNRFEEAIVPLRAALANFQSRHDSAHAAGTMIDLAWAYFQLGQFDKSRELYEAASKDAAPVDRALCIGHLGNIAYERGDLPQAIRSYKEAASLLRDLKPEWNAEWLGNVALALADQEQWDDAESYNAQALQIAQSPGLLIRQNALVTSGRIAFGRHDYQRAEQQLQSVEQSESAPAALLDAHAALANVYAATGQNAASIRQYEEALRLVDHERSNLREDENKITYLDSVIKLNQQYVAYLMDRKEPEQAFQVSEMSRARILRDRLNLTSAPIPAHRLAEYKHAAADTQSAYLIYWIAPKQSFLWVIGPHCFTPFTLPGKEKLAALVNQYQHTLDGSGRRSPDDIAAGAKLFQQLVEPARALLPATKRFVIVPDGPLYDLNFETLPAGDRYWIQDATISVAPSLDLLLSRAPPATPARLLLIGNAAQWTPEFPPLLNAGKEMERIERRLSESAQTVLSGAQATSEAYAQSRPAQFSYIHFAAHAIANRAAPLESAIILSNGRLTAKDVLATPVNARLVTISACSSAGARTYAGEGLVGLAWAFLRSGARGVIAGLWDVSDHASPLLMDALYAGLARGESPADALRAAKLTLLEPGGKFTDPFYWGAFQLYLGAR